MDNDHLVLLGEAKLADGDVWEIPVFPAGMWKTGKYPSLDLSLQRAKNVVKNIKDNVLGREVRMDVDHKREAAGGWVKDAYLGTFTDGFGKEQVGPIVKVEPTVLGRQAVQEGLYKYVSADIDKHQVPNGPLVFDVLKALTFTNDPVMPMPAIGSGGVSPVSLSEDAPSLVLLSELSPALELGELTDAISEQIKSDVPAELQEAAWAIWNATYAYETKVREALKDGLTGEELQARMEELAADLPAATALAIKNAVAQANEPAKPLPVEDVQAVDPTLSEGHHPASTPVQIPQSDPLEGVTMSEQDAKLAEQKLAEREAQLAEREAQLAEREKADRTAKLSERVEKLTLSAFDKARIRTLVTAEVGGSIVLSENAAPVTLSDVASMQDAFLSIVETLAPAPHKTAVGITTRKVEEGGAQLSEGEADAFLAVAGGDVKFAQELAQQAASKSTSPAAAFAMTPDEAFDAEK